ncbi:BQ2448_5683 [Microbotryum intermedium]|uniref:BQ2448_5683 protein n=1 Tax=Microbotryum intermedium TaxID=269621 RepID=A0A238F1W6_9BASI|nr:BQ2448_5683 [Microbotryum intermedium]
MSAHRPLCYKATKIVADVLRTQGPLTTQSLYDIVHSTHPASLPARPLPNRYLTGHSRDVASVMRMRREHRQADDLPREAEDTDGTWSMAYLKRKVLAGMQEKGQVVKMTKIKWDKLRGVEATKEQLTTTTEGSTTTDSASTKQATKKLQNHEKKSADTHFWVLMDQIVEEGIVLPQKREPAASTGRRSSTSRPTTTRGKVNQDRF